jgi:glutaredoxin
VNARRHVATLRASAFAAFLSLLLAAGCRQSNEEPAAGDGEKASAAPKTGELPPLSIQRDTPNLLLTWVDEKGDFHVVQKVDAVPAEGKKTVRVVMVGREEGTGELVYVADLNETAPDGSYRLKTMSRSAWDEIGAGRRKARLEALAPSAPPPPSAAPAASSAQQKSPDSRIVAIIYGADWCKPCHSAGDYLKARGITVIHKNIEASEAAQAEMNQKLARAGRGGASIPVIDIMGQLLVGFSPSALDQAVQNARNSKAL